MAIKLSRTKLARYVAEQLQAGNRGVMRELAAYLIDSRRVGEADLIVRSIFEQLERSGHVVADITSTHELSDEIRQQVARLTGAETLELRQHIDPSVLGGVRIQTPSRVLDATVQRRITTLRERKI